MKMRGQEMYRIWSYYKKGALCFFMLNALLLVGCGGNSSHNDIGTNVADVGKQAAQTDVGNATNAVDTVDDLWEQHVQVDECEMFQKSDLIQHSNDKGSEDATWENDKAQAYLKTVDNNATYLTYKSKLGECVDVPFDFVQAKSITNTKFYEEDINADGDKELLISYTQGTGTGVNFGAMCIYDLNNNELIPLFDKSKFSDEQKQDIFDSITMWNSKGFQEKSDIEINDISAIKPSVFVPTLVNVQGKYMVQVEFMLRDSAGKDYQNSKGFFALLEFRDEQLDIDSLWCEL